MNNAVFKLKRFIMRHVGDLRVLALMDDMYRIAALPFAFVIYVVTTRILQRPYFGVWMGSEQGNPLRYPMMRQVVARCMRNHSERGEQSMLQLMEVGAYAGASAIEFASELKDLALTPFRIYSVDPWDAYLDVSNNSRIQYRLMNLNLARGNVLRLFIRNVRYAGVSDVCRQIRGKSEEVLSMIKDQQFDFIYIDGDHAPEAVRRDLYECARLLKPGGYLSGDDLELQMDELDPAFVQKHANSDIALDPKSGKVFHPGVAIAVHEFFGRPVTSYDGFWVVRWNGETYEDVVLPSPS